jgi:uncharacterized protein YaeQ
VALTSTLYTLEIALSHVDRHVYEPLSLRVPMHPSESPAFFVTRVLAWCLEYTEGIAFSRGIADPEEPTLFVRDLTGALQAWFEIGAPDAARVHKAAKAAPRVAIYTHRDPAIVRRAFVGERIHRAESIAVHAIDRDLVEGRAPRRAPRAPPPPHVAGRDRDGRHAVDHDRRCGGIRGGDHVPPPGRRLTATALPSLPLREGALQCRMPACCLPSPLRSPPSCRPVHRRSPARSA